MFTQSQLDHLTDLSESLMATSEILEKILANALPYCRDLGGFSKEEILGQALTLKVLSKDLDLSLVEPGVF